MKMSDKTRREVLSPVVLGLVGLWAASRCSRRRRKQREDARRRREGPSVGDHVTATARALVVAAKWDDVAAWKAADEATRARMVSDGRVFTVPARTRIYVRLTRGLHALIEVRSGELSGRNGWVERRSLRGGL